jgi:Met-zincin
VDELNRLFKIRSVALSRFGENNIQVGAPIATLDEVLLPLYFLHRYQTEAVSKVLGGNEYTYALRGDGEPITKVVAAAEQRRALKVLLQTIDPETLTLPPPGQPIGDDEDDSRFSTWQSLRR